MIVILIITQRISNC